MTGLRAFREAFLSAESYNPDQFEDFESRRVRYEIFWSMYENTAYREIHAWARSYKRSFGLYRYIRNIYNPAYRLGEFWKSHLWGGGLDPGAGDGEGMPSALPIITDNQRLRPAIADVWRYSNWPVRKDIVALHGTVMGDTFLRVVDDLERRKVYLEAVHPGTVSNVDVDPFGNVKGYEIKESRPHPDKPNQTVVYVETAKRGEREDVVYRTYLNETPYAWNGIAAEWVEPYGFIPLVHIKHNDVGLDFGWSELHPARSKMHELDDLASVLSDQIRKSVNPFWLFSGLRKGDGNPTATTRDETAGRPEPGREETPALYAADPDARAIPLVAQLPISESVVHITEILKDLERDYPELKFDALRASGEISGRALRVARQPVETKVLQRRAIYDDALVRAQQMAVAIGGFRSYPGFEGFGLDSYAAGALDHHIGERPVFAVDELDDWEESKMFWAAAVQATTAGMPLKLFLKHSGWSENDLLEFEGAPEVQARRALMTLNQEALAAGQQGRSQEEEEDEDRE